MTYEEFIRAKEIRLVDCGLAELPELNPALFDFQRMIVEQALRKGRYAIFCDCGLGKTAMQLEWAAKVPGRVLILAPLAVAQQTVREGDKFGHEVKYVRGQNSSRAKIHITNYEMIEHFSDVDKDYDAVAVALFRGWQIEIGVVDAEEYDRMQQAVEDAQKDTR